MIYGEGLNRYIIPLRQNEGEKEKDPDFDKYFNPYLLYFIRLYRRTQSYLFTLGHQCTGSFDLLHLSN